MTTQILVIIDRDTYEEQYPGHGRELTSSYCSRCGTTQKEVGAFKCDGNKVHLLCDLIK